MPGCYQNRSQIVFLKQKKKENVILTFLFAVIAPSVPGVEFLFNYVVYLEFLYCSPYLTIPCFKEYLLAINTTNILINDTVNSCFCQIYVLLRASTTDFPVLGNQTLPKNSVYGAVIQHSDVLFMISILKKNTQQNQ